MKRGRMRARLVLALSILLAVSVVVPGCGAPTPAPTELTEDYIRTLPSFCPKAGIEDIDLTVLQDVVFILETNSVFMSPVFEETFGKTGKDQDYLLRKARDTIFSGFLGIPPDQIPQWAKDWVEAEISSGNYDYEVFNRIYQELIQEPQYEYLKDPSQKEKLLKVSIEGMIRALEDPFTTYISRDYWKTSEEGSLKGRYQGVGIGVTKNERGEIAISIVSPGSPAEKAGLKPGDAILAVDGKSTLECTTTEFVLCIKAMRDTAVSTTIRIGPFVRHIAIIEEPTLNLIVRRKLTDELEEVQVTMEEIKVRDLYTGPGVELPDDRGSTGENLPYYYPLRDREGEEHPEILYIFIEEFTHQMAMDLEYVLENLDMEKFAGVIVDVRGNTGGRVDALIYCVDYFLLGEELISTMKYADGTVIEHRHDQWDLVPEDIPLVVLVDKGSASGAELFPAALRDNGRAVIIGKDERTAGKGSVNYYFSLRDGEYGALYVSIGFWYTPSGQMIEAQDLDHDGYYEIGGITPDILVEWTDEDIIENQRDPAFYDPTLFKAIEYISKSSGMLRADK